MVISCLIVAALEEGITQVQRGLSKVIQLACIRTGLGLQTPSQAISTLSYNLEGFLSPGLEKKPQKAK